MADPSFNFRVGLTLRRALPYYNDAGPQSEFFEAATRGDVRRLRGEPSAHCVLFPPARSPLPGLCFAFYCCVFFNSGFFFLFLFDFFTRFFG